MEGGVQARGMMGGVLKRRRGGGRAAAPLKVADSRCLSGRLHIPCLSCSLGLRSSGAQAGRKSEAEEEGVVWLGGHGN